MARTNKLKINTKEVNAKRHSFLFNDIASHKPPLQASSSPLPRIRKRPILWSDYCHEGSTQETPSKEMRQVLF